MRYAFTFAALAAAVTALPAVVSQIADGQVQAPTGYTVTQIADGQIQAPTGNPVTQIADGQIQAPGPKATGTPVSQISDGQIQAPGPKATGMTVSQIFDGQIQAPGPKTTGTPVQQISDGQIQAPGPKTTGTPVQQISDGQIQAPKPSSYASSESSKVPAPAKSSSSAAASTLACPVPTAKATMGPGAAKPQVPFKFPLANGFPNITVPSSELTAIEKLAQGTLPNGGLPTMLSDASTANLQLIAFNEIFEVAYFNSLLANLTAGEYNIGAAKDFVVQAISTIQAQEQLHALGANAILASANRTTIEPCQYKFPVSNFDSAIATASLFTEIVLGTLQAAQNTFATTGDAELVGLVGSIIGQEGAQDGYYRATGRKVPSANPFLTGGAGTFAFSALNQLFVVPGTCGNLDVLTTALGQPLSPLTVVTAPPATGGDVDVTYSYPVLPSITSAENLRLVLINQQNVPLVFPLSNVQNDGSTVTFTAPFPYTNATLDGLTIAAVTNGNTTFASVAEVAASAVWGPGLITVN